MGGKDIVGNEAPTEMIKHGEQESWTLVEIEPQPASLPFVGMKALTMDRKLYILGQ